MNTTVEGCTIIVNGEPREVQQGLLLPDLLRRLHIDPENARGIAVAVNDDVVLRRTWAEVAIRTGDRIEVVTAKQGG